MNILAKTKLLTNTRARRQTELTDVNNIVTEEFLTQVEYE